MSKLVFLISFLLIGSTIAKYDFIIAGGGTAGSVLAAELSSNPSIKVLLLEEGDDNSNIFSTVVGFWNAPAFAYGAALMSLNKIVTKNYFTKSYYSQETPYWGFRGMEYQSGNSYGGGSTVNGNAFSRFTSEDLTAWNNSYWTYNNTLNDWKSLETCAGTPSACNPTYHGTSGPIVTNSFVPNSVLQKITDVMPGVFNVPVNPDTNGPVATGVGPLIRNIDVTSTGPIRQDSYSKFLKPVLSRPNLDVLTGARVVGVELKKNGKNTIVYHYQGNTYYAKVKKEIILSMGVINTPKVLMLSGIGDCLYLESLGIDCIVNNRNVGKNFQDSAVVPMVYGTFTAPTSPGDPGAVTVAFYASPGFTDGTDMEAAIATISGPPVFPTSPQLYLWQLAHLRLNGVGELKLQSKNPNLTPLFSFNLYNNDYELMPLVDQFKKIRQIMALANISAFELKPGYTNVPFGATDAQITTWLKDNVNAMYHTIGSCSINHVVDGRLRLINGNGVIVPGIRIVDNSVIPIKGRTHSTSSGAMFIGKVGSRFIKEDWNIN